MYVFMTAYKLRKFIVSSSFHLEDMTDIRLCATYICFRNRKEKSKSEKRLFMRYITIYIATQS